MTTSANLLCILKRVYYVSCTIGLSHFSFDTLNFKPFSLLYNLFLSIPVGYNIWLLFNWVKNPSDLPKTAVFFLTMNDSFVYCLAILSWITVVVNHKRFVDTVKDIIAISTKIIKTGVKLSLGGLMKIQLVFLVVFIMLSLLKYFLDQIVDSGDSHWIGFYIADATNNIVIVQFTNLLWILKEYYGCINIKIKSYLLESYKAGGGQLNQLQIFDTSTVTRGLNIEHTTSILPKNIKNNKAYLIKELRTILNSVYLLSSLVNSLFSLQLLLYIGNFIVEITVTLYILYYSGVYKVTEKDLVNPLFWIYIISQILVIVSDSFQIVTMISASEDVSEEVSNDTFFI